MHDRLSRSLPCSSKKTLLRGGSPRVLDGKRSDRSLLSSSTVKSGGSAVVDVTAARNHSASRGCHVEANPRFSKIREYVRLDSGPALVDERAQPLHRLVAVQRFCHGDCGLQGSRWSSGPQSHADTRTTFSKTAASLFCACDDRAWPLINKVASPCRRSRAAGRVDQDRSRISVPLNALSLLSSPR